MSVSQLDLTLQRVGKIEARANAATGGPWLLIDRRDVGAVRGDAHDRFILVASNAGPIDGPFIRDARSDVPWLCSTARELAEDNRRLRAQFTRLADAVLRYVPSEVMRDGYGPLETAFDVAIRVLEDYGQLRGWRAEP